jgi:hypothetical protein
MISRGEVGLIVAGVGVSAGALIFRYTTVIIMVTLTTIITPNCLEIVHERYKFDVAEFIKFSKRE